MWYPRCHMAYHRFLFAGSAWVVFITLLALPRGLQAIFIIIGILPILLVGLALGKNYRLGKRGATHAPQMSTQQEKDVEQLIDKAADDIVETILEHPGLVHDAEIETRNVVHQLYEALGETEPSQHYAPPVEPAASQAPKSPRRPRKASSLSESFASNPNQEQ